MNPINKAFNLELVNEKEDLGIITFRKAAHDSLDQLFDAIKNRRADGGACFIRNEEDSEVYRLTFCDFSGLHDCPFCQGTGAQRNNA